MTLIELMVVLIIVAVLTAIAAPSMYEYIMRKRVQGVADELLINLRLMRSSSVVNVGWAEIQIRQSVTVTCYAVYSYTAGGTCDCLQPQTCSNQYTEVHKVVELPLSGQVRVTRAAGSAARLTFNRVNGLPNGTIQFEVWAPQGGKVRVSTNSTGQPSICSLSGHEMAYPAC